MSEIDDYHVIPTVEEQLAIWEMERGLATTDRNAVYVSTPITTGRRFVDWRAHVDSAKHDPVYADWFFRSEVVLPNLQHSARAMEKLRWGQTDAIVDPTSMDVRGWSQSDYHEFWKTILARHVRRVVFLDGWELSAGCVIEFELAQELRLECVDESMSIFGLTMGVKRIRSAIEYAEKLAVEVPGLRATLDRLVDLKSTSNQTDRRLFKDAVLDDLADMSNVAQFVSFGPGRPLDQRFCRIVGYDPNHRFETPAAAIRALIERSPEQLVNLRTFDPVRPEGNPFIEKLHNTEEILSLVQDFAEQGLFSIVNERIDVGDGGVSGVSYRGIVEFAPDETPRCVDKVDVHTASFPFEVGMKLLKSIYAFEPDLRCREGKRVEFSIHPDRRGWKHGNTIIWQAESRPAVPLSTQISWPNQFSRFLGDKVFGLVLAFVVKLPVPRTVVYTNRLFPFSFGESTGSKEIWTRTCPSEKHPGYYPTARGWFDPYQVLNDPWVMAQGGVPPSPPVPPPPLSSVIVQEGVNALFSGRVVPGVSGAEIKGVKGTGDKYMSGDEGEETIPPAIRDDVREMHEKAEAMLGPVSVEWVHDGFRSWVVQLNRMPVDRIHQTHQVDDANWEDFKYGAGSLEEFRDFVRNLVGTNKGVRVIGNVSRLSHAGEIVDVYGVPAEFRRPG